MPLSDILKRKDSTKEHVSAEVKPEQGVPVFTLLRTDTHSQEVLTPPPHPEDEPTWNQASPGDDSANESRASRFFGGRSRSVSTTSTSSEKPKLNRSSPSQRLSQRLHLRRDLSSSNVPQFLPEITSAPEGDEKDGTESQWEHRATILVKENDKHRSQPDMVGASSPDLGGLRSRPLAVRKTSDKLVVATENTDDNIQEAIRLHEAGELETSTQMFGRLADPNGENNALSQVLYGLALR